MNYRLKLNSLVIYLIFFTAVSYSQQYFAIDFDTVKAQKFDMGKMWTFENPPLDYFEKLYNFRPSNEWLDKVQKSALKFGNGCSASFVSADGLIMTNHHCVRSILARISREDEDLLNDGFYAETLEDERPVPHLFVKQLMMIEDVTAQVVTAMNKGENDSAKIILRNEKIEEIKTAAYNEHPELEFQVVSLYYGGKYSLYGYKKYNDIRLVFVPELWVAKLGGDYDNFTYPRYGLDCAFLRAYNDEGNPVNTDYYFNWSNKSIEENQPVFVVGNPGSTNRIYTVAQLEFIRDYRYGLQTPMRRQLYSVYDELLKSSGELDTKIIARLYSVGNGLKVYEETYKALQDPYFIARKNDFETNFKQAVQSGAELNKKYGDVWDKIAQNRKEAAKIAKERFALSLTRYYSPVYFFIAQDLITLAKQLQLPDEDRADIFKEENLGETINYIYPDFNEELEKKKLLVQVNVFTANLKSDDEILYTILDNKTGSEAVEYLLSKTIFKSSEDVIKLAEAGADAILNSGDPFIKFMLATRSRIKKLNKKYKRLEDSDAVNNQLLGEALYKVYGDAIPPDATGTLRISDGVIKGYEYNGTRAPYKTTFYGSLDRYYSFDKKFPFNLPAYWEDLPEEFDPSTPLDFVSTNDIIGGNSGSPVINSDAEVVGLAFDGNIESHSGRFIYTTRANRTVSVSAEGMIEAITNLYKAKRLSDEILKQ